VRQGEGSDKVIQQQPISTHFSWW